MAQRRTLVFRYSIMKKRRDAFWLAVNSAAAFGFTLALLGLLTSDKMGLPQAITATIGPQVIKIVWPLLAMELLLCTIGVVLFFRARKRC